MPRTPEAPGQTEVSPAAVEHLGAKTTVYALLMAQYGRPADEDWFAPPFIGEQLYSPDSQQPAGSNTPEPARHSYTAPR